MMKYSHKLDTTDELVKIQKKVRRFILKAKYKEAYNFLLKISKKYPNSYYIASMLATLNAEDAFVLPEKQKKKIFKIAAKKLRILLYSTKGATTRLKNRNINEYYWFSEQHNKQYYFGVKNVQEGDIGGLYSQGVGAGNYAFKLIKEGKRNLGLKWAQKSESIWKEYFKKISTDYHDPWFWYALALGLQGKENEANLALKKSAKLAKKNLLSEPAFKKLREMINIAKKF